MYVQLAQKFTLRVVFGENHSEGMTASAVSCSVSIPLVKMNECSTANKHPKLRVKSSAQTNHKFVDTWSHCMCGEEESVCVETCFAFTCDL